MGNRLQGKHIAFLATNGVEQSELSVPWQAVMNEGANVDLVSTKPGQIYSMQHDVKGQMFTVDKTTTDAQAADYDALVIPGGVASPDRLRLDQAAVKLVQDFLGAGKPVASICHGPWMLVEADAVRGRTITSWPSLKTDIRNAGGTWVDEEVHVDNGIVTSRKPDDLTAFSAKTIEEILEGTHAREPAGSATAAVR
jgi:protease I